MAKRSVRPLRRDAARQGVWVGPGSRSLNDSGAITDDTRIRAALPTINDLTGKGAKVILSAHGRPKGAVKEDMLSPCGGRLGELLGARGED